MPSKLLILCFLCGLGLVETARRGPPHAAALEWLGGLCLASGLVGLGMALATG